MEGHYEYSDDFEEESDGSEAPKALDPLATPSSRGRVVRTKRMNTHKKRDSSMHYSTAKKSSMFSPSKASNAFSPRDREMSACHNTIRKLTNKITEGRRELEEAKKENKLLNRLRVRQEKELNRFQSQEGELPQLLNRHAEEVRVLREHLKRSLANSQKYQKQMTEYRQEILQLGDHNKKLETVVSKKNLLGRDRLTQQLHLATNLLKEKDNKIAELERRLELANKHHVTEIRALIQKNKLLSTEIQDEQTTSQKVRTKLKQKEKDLDVMNMYTQRFGKMANEQSSFSHPSTLSQFTQTTPPPPPAETVQSTQTSISLDPISKTAELVVLSSKQKVVDSQITEDKAVQTSTSMEGAVGGAMGGAMGGVIGGTMGGAPTSRPERDSHAQDKIVDTKLPPSHFKGLSGVTTTHTSTRMKSQTSNEGLHFSSVAEEEKRKKENLLAKLRAIDSIKNPPESRPVESTAMRGSGFAGIGKHDSSETQAKSLTGSDTHSSQHSDGALPVAHGHPTNIDPTTFGSPPKNTLQSSNSKTGIQNLLLGESQPFQPLKSSYHGAGNPSQSFSTAEATRTSADNKVTGNTLFESNFETTQSYSLQQDSLFNLSNKNLTKASTDLSSLMNGDNRTHVDSNMTTVAGDLTKAHSTQPSGKKKALPSFMSTSTGNGRRASPMKNKEIVSANRTPSNSSLQSWPDTVQNLHSGKPAYSTGTDPFGSKHIAVLAQKPPPVDKSSRGSEHREYKPLHGRRATSMFIDTSPVIDDTHKLPKHLEMISENHPGSTAYQKTANLKPRERDSYPWEIAIDVEADELNTESPAKSRKSRTSASKSLLPLRPKQNENSFGMVPGASFEADDLEEVVI